MESPAHTTSPVSSGPDDSFRPSGNTGRVERAQMDQSGGGRQTRSASGISKLKVQEDNVSPDKVTAELVDNQGRGTTGALPTPSPTPKTPGAPTQAALAPPLTPTPSHDPQVKRQRSNSGGSDDFPVRTKPRRRLPENMTAQLSPDQLGGTHYPHLQRLRRHGGYNSSRVEDLFDVEAEEEPGVGSMLYYDNNGVLQRNEGEVRAEEEQQAFHNGIDGYDYNDGWMVPDDAPIEYADDHPKRCAPESTNDVGGKSKAVNSGNVPVQAPTTPQSSRVGSDISRTHLPTPHTPGYPNPNLPLMSPYANMGSPLSPNGGFTVGANGGMYPPFMHPHTMYNTMGFRYTSPGAMRGRKGTQQTTAHAVVAMRAQRGDTTYHPPAIGPGLHQQIAHRQNYGQTPAPGRHTEGDAAPPKSRPAGDQHVQEEGGKPSHVNQSDEPKISNQNDASAQSCPVAITITGAPDALPVPNDKDSGSSATENEPTAVESTTGPHPIPKARRVKRRFGDVVDVAQAKKDVLDHDPDAIKVVNRPDKCMVTQKVLWDPLLAQDYPALAEFAPLFSGTVTSWSRDRAKPLMRMMQWPAYCPDMDFDLAMALVRFARLDHFMNPSRASYDWVWARDIPTTSTSGSGLSRYLAFVDGSTERHVVWISTIRVTESYLIRPGSGKIVRHGVQGLGIIQECERMLAFFAMIFRRQPLQGQIRANAIEFSTRDQDTNASPAIALAPTASGTTTEPWSLPYEEEVPIYDARDADFDPNESMNNLANVLPRYHGEVPENSCLTVGYTATAYQSGANQSWKIGFNLLFGILAGSPA